MANAEGDDDVEDAEPHDVDNEAREMNDWVRSGPSRTILWAIHCNSLENMIINVSICWEYLVIDAFDLEWMLINPRYGSRPNWWTVINDDVLINTCQAGLYFRLACIIDKIKQFQISSILTLTYSPLIKKYIHPIKNLFPLSLLFILISSNFQITQLQFISKIGIWVST